MGLRVVKGGNFRNEASTMKLHNRGDVYMVTSATRAVYVGFRLAFGVIPDPRYIDDKGRSDNVQYKILATAADVGAFTGTYLTKLVFRNDLTGNLVYIDYSNGFSKIVEIKDTLDAYHPEISPNGNKVAFCTGLEGVSKNSVLYVRDLKPDGGNLVKLEVESAVMGILLLQDPLC